MTDATVIIVALIAAAPPTVVSLVGNRRVDQVHTLVNSKMTAALAEIADLKSQVVALGGIPNKPKEGT